MGASLALAGVTACTKQPAEKIVPYVKQPEELIPGKPLFYATSMPLGGVAIGLLVESHEGRPTKVEGNPLHPGSLGATDVFAQAAILGLYDPDRSQTLTNLGEIRPWSSFLGAINAALTAQKPLKGAGLRILTESVSSPTLAAQIRELLARFPSAKWHQWDPASRDNVRVGSAFAFTGEYVDAQYRFEQADVILSLDADFLGSGPGSLRYAREFAARRRPENASRMNRLYAVESMPTSTGSRADHRLPARPSEIGAIARAIVGAMRHGGRQRTPAPQAVQQMDRRRRQGSAGEPRQESGHRRRQSAASGPRARARDEPGARQRRQDRRLHPDRRSRTGQPARVAPRSRRRHERRQGRPAGDRRRQSGVHRAGGSEVRRRHGQGPAPRPPQPLRRRDVGAVPVADPGSALSRGVERRARLRRHRLDRAAADCAALRRQVGARAARGDERPSRTLGPRHRPRPVEDRQGRDRVAPLAARRRDPGHRVRAENRQAVAESAAHRSTAGRRVSRFRSGTIRRSSTAGSPTTAGCRSCRSRSRG